MVSSNAYVLFYRRRDTLALSSVPASLSTDTENSENDDTNSAENSNKDENNSNSAVQTRSDDMERQETSVSTTMDLD